MPFPVIAASPTTVVTTNSSSWSINVPAHNSGDMLLLAVGMDGAPTINSVGTVNGVSWAQLTNTPNGTANKLYIAWLRATSNQATDMTVAFDLSATEQGVARVWRIRFAHPTSAPVVGTAVTGSSTAPNSGIVNPAGWDVEDTMWFSLANTDAAVTATTFPSNMDTSTGFSDVSGGGNGAGLHTCRLESAVASLDPNAFGLSATETWVAQTVAIRPAPSTADAGTATGVAVPSATETHIQPAAVTTQAVSSIADTTATGNGTVVSSGTTVTQRGVLVSTEPSFLGIASGGKLGSPEYSQARCEQEIDDYVEMGLGHIRADIPWSASEPTTPGTYDWTWGDKWVPYAHSVGLKIIVTVSYSPGHVTGQGGDIYVGPSTQTDWDKYAAFCAAVVARYPYIHGIEIWNEPNINGFWRNPQGTIGNYVNMLQTAYPAIKAANSDVVVILAGTAGSATDATNFAPAAWLGAVYSNGGQGYFDAVAIHPYTATRSMDLTFEWETWDFNTGGGAQGSWLGTDSLSVPSRMTTAGDGSKPIYITEVGYVNDPWTQVYAVEAFITKLKTYARVKWVSWYSWRQDDIPSDPYERNYLVDATTYAHRGQWGMLRLQAGLDFEERSSFTFNAASGGTGAYTAAMSGLSADTDYYALAYAVNSSGDGYGTVTQFATASGGTIYTDSGTVTGVGVPSAVESYQQKAEKLSDAFSGASLDSAKWTTVVTGGTSLTVTGGVARITIPGTSGDRYFDITSQGNYDLRASHFYMNVAAPGSGSTSSTERGYIMVFKDADNWYSLSNLGSNCVATKRVAGSTTQVGSTAGSKTWMRVRESGGTIFFDHSTDGINWTNFASDTALDVSVVKLGIGAGAFSSGVGYTIDLDNVNVAIYADSGTATGVASPSASENYQRTDAGTAVGVAAPSAVEGHERTDDGTSTGVAAPSATEVAETIDAATVVGVAEPSANESFGAGRRGIVSWMEFVVPASAATGVEYTDSATITGTAELAAEDIAQFTDADTAVGVGALSATDLAQFDDTGAVTGSAEVTASDVAQFIDAETVTGIADVFAIDVSETPDSNVVVGVAAPSATDTAQFVDAGTSTAVAQPSGQDERFITDAATVTGVADASAVESHEPAGSFDDVGTVTGLAAPVSTDTAQFVDAATATASAEPSGTEGHEGIDVGTATGTSAPQSVDVATFVDAGEAIGSAAPSANESAQPVDSATVSGTSVPSATDLAAFVDADVVVGMAVVSGIEEFQGASGSSYTDAATVTGQGAVSAVETAQWLDAGQITGIAQPSGTEDRLRDDAGTAIGVAAITGVEDYVPATVFTDAGTVFGVGLVSGLEQRDALDLGTVVGVASISGSEAYIPFVQPGAIGRAWANEIIIIGQAWPRETISIGAVIAERTVLVPMAKVVEIVE